MIKKIAIILCVLLSAAALYISTCVIFSDGSSVSEFKIYSSGIYDGQPDHYTLSELDEVNTKLASITGDSRVLITVVNGRFVKVTLTKHEQSAWDQISHTGCLRIIKPNELPENIQKQVDEVTDNFYLREKTKNPTP